MNDKPKNETISNKKNVQDRKVFMEFEGAVLEVDRSNIFKIIILEILSRGSRL